MMVVPAPLVRLPDSHGYALWPLGYTACHSCNHNKYTMSASYRTVCILYHCVKLQ